MLEKHTGIILKTYFPKKTKVALLDQHWGKIEAVPPTTEIGIGFLLEYRPRSKGRIFILEQMEVHDVPLQLAKADILFLHHVLEICYFGVPFGSCVPEVFVMVNWLYSLDEPLEYPFKIAFVFKLLTTLGMYPYEARFQESYFYNLAIESIDSIATKSIDLKVQQGLHNWIYASISQHPLIQHFKTIDFLTNNRIA